MKEEIQKNSKKTKEKQKQIPLLQQSHYQVVSNIMLTNFNLQRIVFNFCFHVKQYIYNL